MDIFSALQTSVSGLKSQSYAIGNISGNIANSQTTGYKRIDTSFIDLIADQTPGRESAGSVFAQARLTNAMQGNVIATQTPTNMAIQGSGFFVVQKRTGDANGQSAFTGTDLYTRRGDFSIDKEGYLVNGAGAYLLGQNVDPSTGQTSTTQPIKLAQTTIAAKGTQTVNFTGNLPLTPSTTASATSKISTYTPTTTTQGANKVVVYDKDNATAVNNVKNFINNSIEGPKTTIYSPSGAPIALNTRWVKTANADAAATTPTDATWQMYYQSDTTGTNAESSWVKADQDVTFDASGVLKTPTTGLTFTGLTINDVAVGDLSLKFNASTLTQFSATSGTMRTDALSQDGYGVSTLNALTVTSEGKITGTFSNGSVVTLGNIAVARFTNPDGLSPDSQGNYKATDDSGPPLAGLVGSSIQGGSVEQSNTDIADEFSKMIVTQQAYSANTRVMSTAQQMMSDLINIVR